MDKPRSNGLMPWVAVLGVDGSGKTSVLQALQAELAPPVTAGVLVLHRRPDILFKPRIEKGSNPYAKPPHNAIRSTVKLGVMVLDWIVGHSLVLARARARQQLVLFDRYYLYDILVDPRRYRFSCPAWLTRGVTRWLPQPTVVILLDVAVDVARGRKQEVPVEESQRQRQAYLDLVRAMPNGHIVDSSQPLAQVVAEVKDVIRAYLPAPVLP